MLHVRSLPSPTAAHTHDRKMAYTDKASVLKLGEIDPEFEEVG